MSEKSAKHLAASELRHRCDATRLGFATTAELPDLDGLLGQERACSALDFGTSLRAHDYNIFALGPPGVGKHAVVQKLLGERAAKEPVAPDWCYVHNFADRSRPRALRFPPGRGAVFKREVSSLLDEVRIAIPRALESEGFRAQTKAIEETDKSRREKALSEVRSEAEKAGIAVLGTPSGMALAAVKNGEVLGPDEFSKLSTEERAALKESMQRVGSLLDKVLEEAPRWHCEAHLSVKKLAREETARAVHHLVVELAARYADFPDVRRYLDELETDVVENGETFAQNGCDEPLKDKPSPEHELPILRRYRVNLVVDNGSAKSAPVVYEDSPTHANLFGRVEHLSVLGALLTDFNLVKTGAVQRANGGYLILDALKLLHQPFSWEELKRTLQARKARIESPLSEMGLGSTVTLSPEPIPIDLKVVLVGERRLYYLLSALDPEFRELFKVAADFEEDVPWSDETVSRYARLLGTIARRERIRSLDAGAVARVVEEAARGAGDQERLSIDLQALSDLLREADEHASRSGAAVVAASHVQAALEGRIHRSDRVRELVHEQIRRGTLLVDVSGKKVGQVNGLSVLAAGDFAFARPTRITARARLGRGEVVDIEREVELGGPIHSKGVLILQGFLAARYVRELPLSLAATLVFEQSYGGVEGDSASLAELCALLSAIGEVPLDQSIALTGSVNQHGLVQPVGGVNEKVEGFFDVCRIAGLTGEQGVALPRANVKNLMLRDDVVEAVRAGKFHVFAVETVDETLALLAGMPAGERGIDGAFPDGTVNAEVEANLALLASSAKAFEAALVGRRNGRAPRHVVVPGSGSREDRSPQERREAAEPTGWERG